MDATFLETTDKRGNKKFQYCRSFHPKERQLASMISNNYKQPYSFVCCSGLNAIEITLRSYHFKYRNHDIYCLYPSELYQETKNLLEFYYESGLFHSVKQFDIKLPIGHLQKDLEQLPKSAEILLFVESCSNPSGYMFNFKKFCKTKKSNVTFIVDNTWLTFKLFNPFEYGANVVVESLSKYNNGGNIIAGAITTGCKYFGEFYIPHIIKITGIHINTQDCDLIISYLPSLDQRMKEATIIFQRLIHQLQLLDNVINICHPFLIHHPSHHIFTKLIKSSSLLPSVFTITVKIPQGVNHFKKMLTLWNIPVMTSFGGLFGRIDSHFVFVSSDIVKMRVALGHNDDTFLKNFVCFIESLKSQDTQN